MSKYKASYTKKGQSDRFVWVAYSDLSTVLMLCFILIFIVLAVINHRKTEESRKLKDFVDSTTFEREKILDKLENVIKEVRKSPQCENTLWNVNRGQNSIQVYFKKKGAKKLEWFKMGEEHLTIDGKRCIILFAKRWLSTIYLDPLREKISQLIVEGHTDSSRLYGCVDMRYPDRSNFLCNLELSQKRSLNAVKVIFANVTKGKFIGNPIEYNWNQFVKWRKERLTATGRSYALPIFTTLPDGRVQEDKDRSRRVEFRFTMKSLLDRRTTSRGFN